jgi:gamma-glutamyltranspeptidase/glutathione hydrolase
MRRVLFSLALFLLCLAPSGPARSAAAPPASFAKGAVAADAKAASEAGATLLVAGGDAIDAAIATALALGVLHPHSSGLGGGGFMLVYRAAEKKTYVLDFREIAPALATAELFAKDPEKIRIGPLSVGVPGEVAGFWAAHQKWGKRPWKELFAPAAKLAKDGAPIDRPLSLAIEQVWPGLPSDSTLKKMLAKADGSMPREGDTLRNVALSKTLEALAKDHSSFYKGSISKDIIAAVSAQGGVLSAADLSSYAPTWREAVRGEYRGFEIVSLPPPSSGGAVIIEILNILERFDLAKMGQNSTETLHLLAEAMQFGFSDRARRFGDPAFVKVPVEMLTSQSYADELAARITDFTHPAAFYGLPTQADNDAGTTHLSVIDAQGNAVALTTTVNNFFGAQMVVGGFPLNDEMDDFSVGATANSFGLVGSSANQVAPGKKPLSSISASMVLKDGQPILVVGASGGPRIISATLQAIVNTIDFGDDVSQAVTAPRVHHQWNPRDLFVEAELPRDIAEGLRARGHSVKELPPGYLGAVAIVQAVGRDPKTGRITAASDPRKGGAPAGH